MTEMDAVCIRYRPPDPPIFSDTPKEASDRMLKLRNESPSYQYYAKLCNITDADSTNIGTSTLSLTASSGGQGWIAAVVIVIVLIIAAAVLVAWIIKRKKTSQYQALFEHMWCFYKSHQRNRGSMSSEGSKKSRTGSSISGEENQMNGRGYPVVFFNQVTKDVKDFKHSSTAQLIDECSLNKSEQGYVNAVVHPSLIELKEVEGSDTQTDGDVIKDDTLSQSHDMEKSLDTGDDNQSKDSSIKFTLTEEEKDLPEYSNTAEQSDQSSNQKDSQSFTEDRQSVTKDMPSATKDMPCATKDMPSATKDRESIADLKSSLDIDLNSQPAVSAVGKTPCLQSQASSDSGYDSQLVSPQDKTEC